MRAQRELRKLGEFREWCPGQQQDENFLEPRSHGGTEKKALKLRVSVSQWQENSENYFASPEFTSTIIDEVSTASKSFPVKTSSR